MVSLRRLAGALLVAAGGALFVQALLIVAGVYPAGSGLRGALGSLLALLLVVVGLPLVLVVVGLRLARVPAATAAPVRPRVRPPAIAPVAPEEVAGLRGPFTACPDCGFLGIRMPQIGDGLWPGGGELGDRKVCPRCGYQGLAVQFDSGEEYAEFLRDIAARPQP